MGGFRLVPPARSLWDHRHAGTGGGLEVWHLVNSNGQNALTTGAPSANILRAFPFVAPARGGVLDRIGYNITTTVAGNTRVGIYTATSESNLYPAALVVDSGSIVNAQTVKTATINVALTPGSLYWVVMLGDAAPTVRAMGIANCSFLLGYDNTLGTAGNAGLSVAFNYAALPATFPAGAAMIQAVPIPCLFLRFSS